MTLFEITTGFTGMAYERCYVWAESEERARKMYAEAFPGCRFRACEAVLSSTDGEFITQLNTEGFGDRVATKKGNVK